MYSEKTCPSTTLSTTNPTWLDRVWTRAAAVGSQRLFFLFVRRDFWYCGHYWPVVPAPDDRWWWLWRNRWNEDWQGKLMYSEKTCPSTTLSTTNPTWLDRVWTRAAAPWPVTGISNFFARPIHADLLKRTYIREVLTRVSTDTPTILSESFRGFPSSLHASAGVVILYEPQPHSYPVQLAIQHCIVSVTENVES
jgi:hypothetical protein